MSSVSRISSPADPAVAPTWSGRVAWATAGVALLFVAAATSVWLVQGAVVPWDSKNHFYPMLRYLGESLAQGEWPLWNPFHFSGHPTVADPQSFLFTPTMVLFALAVPNPSMQLFDVAIAAHVALGAVAVVLLIRRAGWHPAGAVVAAMIYALGGVASSRMQHVGMIVSYAFLPVALLTLEVALERRSVWRAALFGLVAALMAVGRDQVAFLGCVLVLARFATLVIGSGAPVAYLRERLAPILIMGFVGAALLAVPVLVTLQFVGTSNRPSFGFGVAAMGSLPPASLATFVAPNIFGSLNWTYDYWGPGPDTIDGGSWTDRVINYLFAGTVTALLVAWHGLAGRRLFDKAIRFHVVVAVLALFYAFGRFTPFFEVVFDHVPGVNLYRRPADALFIVNLSLAFVAAYLVHAYVTDGLPRLGWATRPRLTAAAAIVVAAAIPAALVAWGIHFSANEKHATPAILQGGLALAALAALAVVFAVGARSARARVVVASLAVAITGAELVARNAASSMNAEPAARYAVFNALPPEQVRGLNVLRAEIDAATKRGERPRVEILGMPNAWQNAGMVLGLEDTIGYNPLRIADFERAVGPGENAQDMNMRLFPGTFRGYRCRLARLLGLEYLVIDKPIENLPSHFPRVRDAELVYASRSMYIYRLKDTAARAYVATRVISVDTEAVLGAGEMPIFDRATEALVATSSAAELSEELTEAYAAGDGAGKRRVTIDAYRRNAVDLTVETDRPGLLVLHDLWYPGWVALVNGQERPVVKANLLFRGVEVPAGRHTVSFVFRPLSFANLKGVAMSLARPKGPPDGVAISAVTTP